MKSSIRFKAVNFSAKFIFVPLLVLNCNFNLSAQEASLEQVIATVNGEALSSADLKLSFFAKQFSNGDSQRATEELIQTLIDRELVRQFLVKRKVKADEILIEQRLNVVKNLVEKKGDDLETVLNKAGLNEEALKELITQQIMWRTYVNSVLTESKIEQFWKENKEKFDGTEIIASQIFKLLKPSATEEEISASIRSLKQLKSEIEQQKLSFAEAATRHSESPSSKSGGALGAFEYYGRVAEPIAAAAFRTKPGAISEPVRSRYGVHLVEVQKRTPGELSLEDARPQIVNVLSENIWEELVGQLRRNARIKLVKQAE